MADAYQLGHAACLQSQPNSDNPYPSIRGKSQQRIDWFNGWYDAKHEAMWPHLFKKR